MAQDKKAADAGEAEVQDAFDEAQRKGYVGVLPDQPDNKEFSLKSGPDSPSALDQEIQRQKTKADQLEQSKGN